MSLLKSLSVTALMVTAPLSHAVIMVTDPFDATGAGGTTNGQTLTIGNTGAVTELDAFINIPGLDLDLGSTGTSAQLSLPIPLTDLDYAFSSDLSADLSDLVLTYTFTNNTGAALDGFQFLAFVDADMVVLGNTFFNEFASTDGALAAGQSFEVDEPGFVFGDIFENLQDGLLDGTNALSSAALADDVSIALAHTLATPFDSGESVSFRVMISEDGDQLGPFSITQFDTPTTADTITFSSEVARQTTQPPTLTASEPATLWLMATVMAIFAGVSRSSKRRQA